MSHQVQSEKGKPVESSKEISKNKLFKQLSNNEEQLQIYPTADYNQILYQLPQDSNKRIRNINQQNYKLMIAIQQFNLASNKIAQDIVDDMLNPQRKFKPSLVSSEEGVQKLKNDTEIDDYMENYDELYLEHNIVFKIASTKLVSVKYHDKFSKFIQIPCDHITIYGDSKIKMLKNEFKYMILLSGHIQKIMEEDSNQFKLRIPLSCLIEYKGFVIMAIAYSKLTIQNSLFDYEKGCLQKIITAEVKQDLSDQQRLLGKLLNLKKHKINFDPKQIPSEIILSVNIEVRQVVQQDVYFILKVGDLMPCDYTTEYESHKRTRQEFIVEYPRELNADALLDLDQSDESHEDDLNLMEALKFFRSHTLQDLIHHLNYVDIGLLYNGQAAIIFHAFGVPLRYMGDVSRECNNNFAILSMQIEMACRSLKKIYRNIQTECFFELQNSKKNAIKDYDDYISDKTNEYLKMILQKSADSQMFWNLILAKQIKYDFNYDLDPLQKQQWSKGQFFYSLQYHLDIEIKANVEAIFREKIIKISIGINKIKCESIGLINRVLQGYKQKPLKALQNLEENLFIHKIHLNKDQSEIIQRLTCYHLLKNHNYDDVILYAKKIIPTLTKPYFQIQSYLLRAQLYLGQIMQAQLLLYQIKQQSEQIWGEFNPILLTIQGLYKFHIQEHFSQYYKNIGAFSEADSLYKLNLIQRLRSLGMNHIKTAKLFEKLGDFHKSDLNQALEYYKQSSLIFETRINSQYKTNPSIIQCSAQIDFKISTVLMEKNENKKAQSYLLHSIINWEKIPKMLDQQILCYYKIFQCLINQEEFQKSAQICDLIWQKLAQHSMGTPQRYEQLFKKAFKVLVQKSTLQEHQQLINQLSTLEINDKDYSVSILDYQKSFENIQIVLKDKFSIISELQAVLNIICGSKSIQQSDLLALNMINFLGRRYFYDELQF